MTGPHPTDRHAQRVCPRTGKPIHKRRRWPLWALWLFPLAGLASLIWYLVRVVPKPSRAMYPCQRVAAPLASGFVVWVLGVLGSAVAFDRARALIRGRRMALACGVLMLGMVCGYFAFTSLPERYAGALDYKDRDPANVPMGVAKGIFPGRVVWVHDPDATDWDGTTGYWRDNHVDLAVVEDMLSKSLRWLTGTASDAAAWDALFRHNNLQRGKGDVGYQPGEKITIKLNLTLTNAGDNGLGSCNEDGDQTKYLQYICHSKELVLALLRQMVYMGGVQQEDIYIGDPTCRFANELYDYLWAEFPNVNYLDGAWRPDGQPVDVFPGRVGVQMSNDRLYWSTPDASGYAADFWPVSYVNAEYMINFPINKAHAAAITVSAKNHYGSLIRKPHGHGGVWYDMHECLPLPYSGYEDARQMGQYRTLVDLLGHETVGPKTMLYLVDSLFGGYGWGGVIEPQKWRSEPFNNDWPSSILVSQDPLAVDSVCYDLWYNENLASASYAPFSTSWCKDYPMLDGGDDYLHEAANPNPAPSGTVYDPENDGTPLASLGVHEHWNDDRLYSRNLGTGNGIELITSMPSPVVGRYLFYNDCRFDNNDPACNDDDDNAIAPDKTSLLPGATATYANYSSYCHGINGIIVDIMSLPGTVTAADFQFKTGNTADPGTWATAPSPTTVMVRPGEGSGGADRVTITWANGAICKTWLQVTVLANGNTGLSDPDVFYFGNAIGETGNDSSNASVTPADEVLVRNNPHTLAHNPAAIDDACDFNRDGKVGPTDAILSRNNGTSQGAGTALILLAP